MATVAGFAIRSPKRPKRLRRSPVTAILMNYPWSVYPALVYITWAVAFVAEFFSQFPLLGPESLSVEDVVGAIKPFL
jgi:hypothetical protein